MQIQHQLGADIIFAFDECTTLMNTRDYQERSVARTHRWAARCLAEHRRLTGERAAVRTRLCSPWCRAPSTRTCGDRRPVILHRWSWMGRGSMALASAGRWRSITSGRLCAGSVRSCPRTRPRHLLGISEPDDIFTAIENGVDTFDCVSPSRVARNAAVYTARGRFNVNTADSRRNFAPIDQDCDCYTCTHYTQAYLHHLFKAREMLASTLCTIHNERFIVRLVDDIRASIEAGTFSDFKIDFLSRYYGSPLTS